MGCYHPLPAWRTPTGEILLSSQERRDYTSLRLPCGGCLGCRRARAQAWALRCQLELQQHAAAVFTTLTYNDEHRPITLDKRQLQLFLKKLRRRVDQKLRFFACGEYGEQTHKPHYHAIIYGIAPSDALCIEDAWTTSHHESLGFVRTYNASPKAIAYTAGYCAKKIGYKLEQREQVDPETGEVYTWQPPFIQMSRKPGIGGHARKWTESWRLYAIHNGRKMAVPRFLHEAWKQQATEEQKEDLIYEKSKLALTRDTTKERLQAQEQIAIKDQQLRAARRTY